MTKVTPYNSKEGKKKQVTKMFDNIAGSYDFLNHTLSLGMDNIWRKIAIKELSNKPATILDILLALLILLLVRQNIPMLLLLELIFHKECLTLELKK